MRRDRIGIQITDAKQERSSRCLGATRRLPVVSMIALLFSICLGADLRAQDPFWKSTGGPLGGIFHPLIKGGNDRLLASTVKGIYQSTDGGLHWSFYAAPPEGTTSLGQYLQTNSGTLLCGVGHLIYRSTNKGQDWEVVQTMPPGVFAQGFHQASDGSIYAGTYGLGVAKSTDDGITWTISKKGMWYPWVMEVTSTQGGILFASSDGGTVRSTDGGSTWIGLVGGWDRTPRTAYVTPTDVVYLLGSPLYRSMDGGATWTSHGRTFESTFRIRQLLINETGAIFVVTVEGSIYRSDNDGVSYVAANLGIHAPNIMSIVATGPQTLLATSGSGLLYRSINNAKSWSMIPTLPTSSVPILHASSSGTVFGVSGGLLVLWRDGDTTWHYLNQVVNEQSVRSMANDTSATIYVGSGNTLMRSKDDGQSWQSVVTISGLNSIYVDSKNRLYTTSGLGLRRSEDQGKTWRGLISPGEPPLVGSVLVLEKSPILLSTVRNSLYRSSNDGDTWTSPDASLDGRWTRKLVRDRDDRIYGIADDILFSSADGGLTWEHLSVSTASLYFTDITITSDNKIVASSLQGVYASSDRGEHWVLLSEGLRNQHVLSIATSPQGFLYCGVENGGIYRSEVPFSPAIPLKEAEPFLDDDSSIRGFFLHQNFPNPFNGVTTLQVSTLTSQHLKLTVYNALGQVVAMLLDDILEPGTFTLTWEVGNRPSGIYFYRLQSGVHFQTRKMVLVK